MRMPRVRFTARRMIVDMAVAALIASGALEIAYLWKLSLFYQRTARSWAKAESMIRKQAAFQKSREDREPFRAFGRTLFDQKIRAGTGDRTRFTNMSREFEARADLYARRKLAFERAARFPWLPVPPE